MIGLAGDARVRSSELKRRRASAGAGFALDLKMDGWVKPGHDGWCFVRAASAISFVMPGLEAGIHDLVGEEGSRGCLRV